MDYQDENPTSSIDEGSGNNEEAATAMDLTDDTEKNIENRQNNSVEAKDTTITKGESSKSTADSETDPASDSCNPPAAPNTDNQTTTSSSVHSDTDFPSVERRQFRDPNEAPIRKLSINLIKTYKHINEVYYEAKRKRQQEAEKQSSTSSSHQKSSSSNVQKYNDGYDDEHYDYKIQINEELEGRYIVKQRIGKGSFGQVVRAWDIKSQEDVAIKIIKSKKPFFRQAKTEIELLRQINSQDPSDQWFIVRLRDTFVHHNHQCLVFEMLSYNLYDLLRNTQFHGVSLNLIRKFARQILKALYFLSQKHVDIIHCDLKPENILLRHPKRSAIKVIDFGSSCKSNKRLYTYIQSRFYRSPEVILGLPYSVAIDMWSLGCILVEMHTGEPLFSGSDEHDQMIRLVAIKGTPPVKILKEGSKTNIFFDKIEGDTITEGESYRVKPRSQDTSIEKELASHSKTLEQILGLTGDGPRQRRQNEPGHTLYHYQQFLDLINRMLDYDASSRITPISALQHPFFKDNADASNAEAQSNASTYPAQQNLNVKGVYNAMALQLEKVQAAKASANKTSAAANDEAIEAEDDLVQLAPRPGSAPATSNYQRRNFRNNDIPITTASAAVAAADALKYQASSPASRIIDQDVSRDACTQTPEKD